MVDAFKPSDIPDYYLLYEATESNSRYMLEQLDRRLADGSVETVCFGGNEIVVTVSFENGEVVLDFVGAEPSWGDAVLTQDIEEFRTLLTKCIDYYTAWNSKYVTPSGTSTRGAGRWNRRVKLPWPVLNRHREHRDRTDGDEPRPGRRRR